MLVPELMSPNLVKNAAEALRNVHPYPPPRHNQESALDWISHCPPASWAGYEVLPSRASFVGRRSRPCPYDFLSPGNSSPVGPACRLIVGALEVYGE